MRAWTGSEVEEERSRLERETATVLGFMIFEYSRLDMELGWFLAWSDDGSTVQELTKKLGDLNFSKRLEYLQKAVASKYAGSPSVLETYNSHQVAKAKIFMARVTRSNNSFKPKPLRGSLDSGVDGNR